jgi:NAD(P)-dependent dehydrogenase (short-subunit alcohol dehydrogenase family)
MSTKQNAVLITGCSSGIGRCLALGLHRHGYRAIATARKPSDVQALADAGLESLSLDLDSSESIRHAVETVRERTQDTLFALINNGAYGQPGAVEDLSRETLRRQFETNVFGTQELTNLVIPIFRTNGGGRIIQISSVLGFVCMSYRGAYNATKFALEALSDTLRLELRGTDIHVSLIEPGPIKSRFREHAYDAYKAHIDAEHSAHRERYQAMERRLMGASGRLPFTLPPEAVLEKVVHALEARRPKIRYAVTFPTYLFAVLKRLLPSRWLDRLLYAVSDRSNR